MDSLDSALSKLSARDFIVPDQALDRMLRAAALFDLYGGLLTQRQREFFDLHYLRDLSLGEISEQYGVSRQSVHDTLARGESYLERVEAALGLLERIQAVLRSLHEAGVRCEELETRVRCQLGDSAEEIVVLIDRLKADISCAVDLLQSGATVRRD